MTEDGCGFHGARPSEGRVQPHIEMSGVWIAAAMCIAPVSPPMASEECWSTLVVSRSESCPQRLSTLVFEVERTEARSAESGPPTMTNFCEGNSVMTAVRIEAGNRLPAWAAPGARVMYSFGRVGAMAGLAELRSGQAVGCWMPNGLRTSSERSTTWRTGLRRSPATSESRAAPSLFTLRVRMFNERASESERTFE